MWLSAHVSERHGALTASYTDVPLTEKSQLRAKWLSILIGTGDHIDIAVEDARQLAPIRDAINQAIGDECVLGDLAKAGRKVLDNWESGDLAGAVNELQAALPSTDTEQEQPLGFN